MRLRSNPNGLWGNACGSWGNTLETHGGIQGGLTYIPPWVFAHRMWKTYSKTTVWGNAAVWEIKSLKGGTTLFPQDSPNTYCATLYWGSGGEVRHVAPRGGQTAPRHSQNTQEQPKSARTCSPKGPRGRPDRPKTVPPLPPIDS